ncbi:hypothetical protein BSKO_02813 [Bryopsis sp. KO-2023]|nr:hypothetical protein BSKO_02813 [Bryopsis sp. KO-2023]
MSAMSSMWPSRFPVKSSNDLISIDEMPPSVHSMVSMVGMYTEGNYISTVENISMKLLDTQGTEEKDGAVPNKKETNGKEDGAEVDEAHSEEDEEATNLLMKKSPSSLPLMARMIARTLNQNEEKDDRPTVEYELQARDP